MLFSLPMSVVSLTVVKAKSSLCPRQWLLHQQCPVRLYAPNSILCICAFMHVFELFEFVLPVKPDDRRRSPCEHQRSLCGQ